MTSQAKAFLCAGLTVLIWSTVSTAFNRSLQLMSPTQLLFVSMVTASAFLSVPLLLRRGFAPLAALSRRQRLRALVPGAMLFCYYSLLFEGYARLPAQMAQPINMTWAIMLALLAAWLYKQRLTPRELAFMLLAYVGVVVIAFGGRGVMGPPDPVGLACIIASTALYALYWIISSRSTLPSALGAFCSFTVAGVLAFVALLLAGQSLEPSLRWPGVYVGLFELAVPFVLWGAAMRLTSAVSRISSLVFLTPFLALFWINRIVGEPIAKSTIAGLILIVVGTLLQQRAAQRA